MISIDRAIRSTCVVTPQGVGPATVLIGDGKILGVVSHGAPPQGVPLDDWENLAILPGLVDTHVHCNEPGRTEWEGFETATKSAIAGGITTIVDMPLNCSPVTTTVDAFQRKLTAAESKLWCDVGFWGGVVPGNLADIDGLIAEGVLGFKAFLCPSGIDEFPHATETVLRATMPKLAAADLPLLVHSELVHDVDKSADPHKYDAWLASRPPSFESNALQLMVHLCDETRCHVHIVHLADALCQEFLSSPTVVELPMTVETCPHYLYFAAEGIPDGATEFKCAPPIRSFWNCDQLWKMLRQQRIHMIVSDHSPCPPEMKCRESGNFFDAWGGIASLQLGLSVVWNASQVRGVGLDKLALWMAEQPAVLAGIADRKGSVAEGSDADLAIFDYETLWTVDPLRLFHRHKLTPYAGRRLQGLVTATYLRGELVYRDGAFVNDQPSGRTILRSTIA